MNNIEEKLWAYIDGTCAAQERQAISKLIADDRAWREKYEELLAFNSEITAMDLDEPSMAFTYKVMEGIRAEYAREPLKATVNKTIVKLIGGFFVITLLALFACMFVNVNWSLVKSDGPLDVAGKLHNFSGMISGPLFKGCMFINIVLGLYLFDGYLRRSNTSKHA